MTHQTPNNTERPNLYSPIRWWVAGLLGCVCSMILLGICFLMPKEIVSSGALFVIVLILPTVLATVIHAKWGRTENHFRNTIATALLSITFPMLGICYGILNFFWIKGSTSWDWDFLPIIIMVMVFIYIPTFWGAIIVWGLFEGCKKFGQQRNDG